MDFSLAVQIRAFQIQPLISQEAYVLVAMADLTHFNPKAGSKAYKGLFSNCTIVPPNTSLAYISTQWAADPATGEQVILLPSVYSSPEALL